ncbi:MAG: SMC-Scp complex subunit ScpB [Gammaproteobacteria bacterium]|nr:SMC-Scp complex subunit ScpB [Gammaproteobacteria bacterium]
MSNIKSIIEALLHAADKPLTVKNIHAMIADDSDQPGHDEIRKILLQLQDDYQDRGVELKQVASGFRLQVRQDYEPFVAKLFQERPPRYTRALLETLALIAYRQPITRGEIEDVRGVSVSTNIIKTLQEREWVRVLGHKDVPGKPALYGTTREFLDYFNVKTLNDLPTLADIRDLDKIHPELELDPNTNHDEVKKAAPAEADEDVPLHVLSDDGEEAPSLHAVETETTKH